MPFRRRHQSGPAESPLGRHITNPLIPRGARTVWVRQQSAPSGSAIARAADEAKYRRQQAHWKHGARHYFIRWIVYPVLATLVLPLLRFRIMLQLLRRERHL